MTTKILKFPNGFLWGTATSAHQIEGNNKNCDWWKWEQSKKYPDGVNVHSSDDSIFEEREWPLEPSNDACDSFNRYEEDFDLCVKMNNNAVRFSIEWARIEPEEGKFDEEALNHYKKMILAAKSRNLQTFVTLHHFTSPVWFMNKGGFANWNAPYYFSRYAKKCAEVFGADIDAYLTINEPQVYIFMSYINGIWPPAKRNPFSASWINVNFTRIHRAAYDAIKSVSSDYKVGIVRHIVWREAFSRNHILYPVDWFVAKVMYFLNLDFFMMLVGKKNDLIGLNYYFTEIVKNFLPNNPDDRISDLGWWICPWGLEKVLLSLKKYNVPIYITENGIADAKDQLRKEFLFEMIHACHVAIEQGVDLKGYFYWSLLDNYEWHHGFWPRFGLIEIDRENNLERKPRASADFYGKIAQENGLEIIS